MIYLNFNLLNPWCKEQFDSLFAWNTDTAFKHKHIEIEVIKTNNLIHFEFGWTIRQDHAGLNFELGLLGYEIYFYFYDARHWDHEKKQWVNYDD